MTTGSKVTPCLWFDTNGEEAAEFYVSVFKNSTINAVTHYGSAGPLPEGTAMTVDFELDGQPFVALNGGSGVDFQFNESVSFQVYCEDQDEVGSRTSTAFLGRSCPAGSPSSSAARTRRPGSGRWRRCFRCRRSSWPTSKRRIGADGRGAAAKPRGPAQ